MMQSETKITRENAITIIKMFAKQYRKELGKVPGEIIIVGGGSIMLNYKFRDATQDFDVILKTVSGVNDIIKSFADTNNLPRDWMNTDFMKTASYSDKLSEVSKHFCTLNNGTLEIRTVKGVYLMAMKLRSHREYRNDISDAMGILIAEHDFSNIITLNDLEQAYFKLYCEEIPDELHKLMQSIFDMSFDELKAFYDKRCSDEQGISEQIISYIDNGANINTRNVEDVVAKIKEKMN